MARRQLSTSSRITPMGHRMKRKMSIDKSIIQVEQQNNTSRIMLLMLYSILLFASHNICIYYFSRWFYSNDEHYKQFIKDYLINEQSKMGTNWMIWWNSTCVTHFDAPRWLKLKTRCFTCRIEGVREQNLTMRAQYVGSCWGCWAPATAWVLQTKL